MDTSPPPSPHAGERFVTWLQAVWSGLVRAYRRHPITFRIAGTFAAAAVFTGALVWNALFSGMPRLPSNEELWAINREPAIRFVDASGATIATRGPDYGQAVSVSELPPHVINAFLAAEDQRFYSHSGVDLRSIARAVIANTSAGRTRQGASTITQQLVKNLILNSNQTIRRKAQEALLAIQLEQKLTKNEILELYLNRLYLGNSSYGVEAASRHYFGKSPLKLSISEAALLAALPKAPSRLTEDGMAKAERRHQHVIDRMADSEFITAAEARTAKAEQLSFVERTEDVFAGHALDHAIEEARTLLPDTPSDMVIQLTLDLDLQQKAEAAVQRHLAAFGKGKRAPEAALILADTDGAIRAMVGGRSYGKSQFNRATQARRQPGSLFKTFVYAAALERGLTPKTVRVDAPIRIGKWQPTNYGQDYRGPVTLATAFSQSINTVAAEVGSEIGPGRIVQLAKRFGVQSPLHPNPSIALGTDGVTLLDMVTGYGVLATGGLEFKPSLIAEIRNSKGDILYTRSTAYYPVYDSRLSQDMTAMLHRVVARGTGRAAQVANWQVAGKTGTSQSWRDAWFVGYTTRYVAGVWVGHDKERAMTGITGGALPSQIFSSLMTAALKGLEPEPLPGVRLDELDTMVDLPAFEDSWLDDEWLLTSENPEDLFPPDDLAQDGALTETERRLRADMAAINAELSAMPRGECTAGTGCAVLETKASSPIAAPDALSETPTESSTHEAAASVTDSFDLSRAAGTAATVEQPARSD